MSELVRDDLVENGETARADSDEPLWPGFARRTHKGPNFYTIVVSRRRPRREFWSSLLTWTMPDCLGRKRRQGRLDGASGAAQQHPLDFPRGLSRTAADGMSGFQFNGHGGLHYALRQLVKQKRCSGKASQMVIGHDILLFTVQRYCLSVLKTAWREADRLGNKVGKLGHSTPGRVVDRVQPPSDS